MDKLVIQGGRPLRGDVAVSGSKNAALPILLATILASGRHEVHNVSSLQDVRTTIKLLEALGARVETRDRAVVVDSTGIDRVEAPYDLVKTMRASVLVLGPLLARFRRARVSLPGGCAIGARPIDLHLKGLKALGGDVQIRHGYVEATTSGLRGGRVYFDTSTVGGTEQILMAAAGAEGETILENAAEEPEIVDLAAALEKMGARIEGAGSRTIHIEGTKELKPFSHTVIPDRIEAGTFMVAAAITGGDIRLHNVRIDHLDALVSKLEETGVDIRREGDGVRVRRQGPIRAVNLKTSPYPGFPTDMQAQMMALMSLAEGTSVISERIFENRFMHVPELVRLGADIRVEGDSATIQGVASLSGAPVMATDLRGSACLVLAGLAGENTTEVSRIYHLDRGYESIEAKLRGLGAAILRVAE